MVEQPHLYKDLEITAQLKQLKEKGVT